MFWTAVLFFDFTWFREQTCLIICPYGRLQSTLVDADTITIGYDMKRGEPRGKKVDTGGDCVDCYRCVAVCPTGIDIRNGVQMECVACTNCIDACDEIMRKVGKPEGLIRYDSERGFETGKRRSLLRPRFAIYTVLLAIGATIFTAVAAHRTSLEVRLLRPQGLPFRIYDGKIENQYTLHVQNKSKRDMVLFVESEEERPGNTPETADMHYVIPRKRIAISPLADTKIPLFATLPRASFSEPFEHTILLIDSLSGESRPVALPFRGP
jgi:cytochrome c oxidase accessory protein FixG